MQRYSLTERGKLLIAMLIVFFLIIPSIIIVVITATRNSKPDESLPAEISTEHSTDSTVPSPGQDNQTGSPPPDSSLEGPISFDLEAGTLTFLFTPEHQTVLDSSTNEKIGELLESPKNTSNAKIAVEIPQLPDEETAKMTTVILNAFLAHDYSINDILFFIYEPQHTTNTYEITVSFQ